jgi:hypothetical protein
MERKENASRCFQVEETNYMESPLTDSPQCPSPPPAKWKCITMQWLRWLVTGLSLRRPGFKPVSLHAGFSCRPLTTEAKVHTCVSPWGISGGKTSTETGSSLTSLVFTRQYHLTMYFHTYISPRE